MSVSRMVIEEGLLDDGDWVYSPQLIARAGPCEVSIEHVKTESATTNLKMFLTPNLEFARTSIRICLLNSTPASRLCGCMF